MDSADLVACVGKPLESAEVQSLLARLGVTQQIRIPKDDNEARVSLHSQGLSLIFKAEGSKSSRLKLDTVQFISSEEEGFTSFSGPLPGGLSFSDVQADAQRKLGESIHSDDEMRLEIWSYGALELSIDYGKDAPHRASTIGVSPPYEG